MSQPESFSLFFTDGASSNKEYHAKLYEVDGGWLMSYQNGKRGGTLTSLLKIKAPVPYAVAKKEFDRTLKEKLAKGYTPDTSGAAYQNTALEARVSGVVPQLLFEVRDPTTVQAWIEDVTTLGQEKHDGERRFVRRRGEVVEGINKKGLVVALPLGLVEDVLRLPHDSVLLDGEILGERLVAFDLLELDGKDWSVKPTADRVRQLEAVLHHSADQLQGLECAITAWTVADKQALYDEVKERCGEGLVYKKGTEPYRPGEATANTGQIKVKFREEATVRVSMQQKQVKRSVAVETVDEAGAVVALGNVTIPPNQAIPQGGDLVEVGYLYLYDGGKLFQPTYKQPRLDQSEPDDLAKFKLKPEILTKPRKPKM